MCLATCHGHVASGDSCLTHVPPQNRSHDCDARHCTLEDFRSLRCQRSSQRTLTPCPQLRTPRTRLGNRACIEILRSNRATLAHKRVGPRRMGPKQPACTELCQTRRAALRRNALRRACPSAMDATDAPGPRRRPGLRGPADADGGHRGRTVHDNTPRQRLARARTRRREEDLAARFSGEEGAREAALRGERRLPRAPSPAQ